MFKNNNDVQLDSSLKLKIERNFLSNCIQFAMAQIITLSKINYKEYPECMFAIIAACLPSEEGRDVRSVAGQVFFRSQDEDGRTYRNGLLHSFDGQPALVVNGRHQEWYKDGKLHREDDLPAIMNPYYQEWWINGKRHRDGNRPAIIDSDIQEWWKNGFLHREGDLPDFINGNNRNNIRQWYNDGNLHRENDLPAIISQYYQEWWINGRHHRGGDI